jgi:hypothetical protein
MKALILSLITLALLGVARAADGDGLFLPDNQAPPRQEFKDGEFIMRWKAERLKLTRAVFRYDTEDKARFWLELDFTKRADPGDLYLFRIDGKEYHGFVLRGEGTNAGGGRWALGFADPNQGRVLLSKIAKAYDLPEKQVMDQTKVEQGSAGSPAKPGA